MPRSARRDRNRTLFRLVNEKIVELHRFRNDEGTHALICECRQLGCGDLVQVPAGVYAALRDDSSSFVVRRGHEDREQEEIVGDHESFLVVRDR